MSSCLSNTNSKPALRDRLAAAKARSLAGATMKQWADKLQCSTRDLRVIGLEESRSALTLAWTGEPGSNLPRTRNRVETTDIDQVEKLVDEKFRSVRPGFTLWVYDDYSDTTGAIEAPVELVRHHWRSLLSLDGDDLVLFDPRAKRGLIVEWLSDLAAKSRGEPFYRITEWTVTDGSPAQSIDH